MAEIKNFGLTGVGPDLQLGKAGPRIKVNGTAVEARSSDGSSLTTIRTAPAVAGNEVVTLSQLESAQDDLSNAISNATVSDGFHLILGDIVANGDGSWTPGAVPLTNSVKVSEAVDQLNEILGKLVPAQPPAFPNGTSITVSSVGSSPVLASGVTDNASTGTAAGASVTRITGTVATNTISTVGPGDSGTIALLINNNVVGSHVVTGTSDNGTYNGLVISGQADYPLATPGFYKSINVGVSGAVANTGVNTIKLVDSAAANTNVVTFVKDTLNTVPTVSVPTAVQLSNGTVAYSSSVPHYNTGATLTVGGSISNLAGQTYYNGNPLSVAGTNSIFGAQAFNYAGVGISTPIAQNTTAATAISPITVNVNGTNVHNVGQAQLTATNVVGSSTAASASALILVKNGSAGVRVDEMSVPVTGLGTLPNSSNAIRVGMATGNTPSNAVSTWVQSASLQTYDAAVTGGVLRNDVTNYSTGYLPAGPNLSGQAAAQYVTFSFNRTALSQFKIAITGTYAGVWISLPGVSDNAGVSPNALGGAWWNAFAAYNGAGVPGGPGDTPAGCASGSVMGGASGTYQMTFGTASSTSATGNTILVRIRLNTGQSISALSFTS